MKFPSEVVAIVVLPRHRTFTTRCRPPPSRLPRRRRATADARARSRQATRGRPSRRAALAGQAAAGRPRREAPPEAARGATHRGAMMRFVT